MIYQTNTPEIRNQARLLNRYVLSTRSIQRGNGSFRNNGAEAPFCLIHIISNVIQQFKKESESRIGMGECACL